MKKGTKAALTVLTNKADDPFAYNDPHTGVNIVESTTTILKAGKGGSFKFDLPELSIAVLDTDYKRHHKHGESKNKSRDAKDGAAE